MENYWTPEFKEFYNELNEFGQKLILLVSVMNQECSREYLNIISCKFTQREQQILIDNFEGDIIDKIELNFFDKNESEFLKNRLLTLDGTLLCDIIINSLRNHKIFN